MKQKKRSLIYLLTLLLVFVCIILNTITASAAGLKKDEIPIPTVQKDVYVYDEDNIIDDDIEKQVNALLIALEEQTGAEIAVVTVKSLLNKEIEDYSYNLANTLGIGKKDEDNGVLLLISKPDKRVRLEIGRGLEGCLPDSKCGRILDDYFVPYRENDEYSEGTHQTIKAVVSVIAKEYGISSINGVNDELAKEIEEKEEAAAEATIWTIIIIIIVIIVLFGSDQIFLGGAIFDSLTSGGGSSSSGGGFSSGGFGGGSFGGGGASR